jgi:phosphoglycolate phosphatase-like HAD superfamily hydrolase
MVGDNSKDIEAGRNIEINTIFSTWGFSREGEADHIAAKPSELLEIINRV